MLFAGSSHLLLLSKFDLMTLSTGVLLIIAGLVIFTYDYNGKPLTRQNIKSHIKFRLEKIPGPGNERYYFIYKGNMRSFYTDTPEFENGFYVRDGDRLLKEEDYSPRLPG